MTATLVADALSLETAHEGDESPGAGSGQPRRRRSQGSPGRFLGLLLLLWLAVPLPAIAQDASADDAGSALVQLRAEQPLSEAAVRDLVARLGDEQVRELLIRELDLRSAGESARAEPDVDAMLLQWRDDAEGVREGFLALARAVPELPSGLAAALDPLPEGGSPRVLALIAVGFALMMLAGWAAEKLARRLLKKVRQQLVEARPEAPIARLGLLLLRVVLDLVFLAIFIVGALAVFFVLWQGNEATRAIVLTYVVAIAAVRLVIILSHFLLAPYYPALRLAHISDPDARYLNRQNIVLASVAAFGFLTCTLLRQLGLADDGYRVLAFAVGVILFATMAYTVLRARKAISGDLAWDRELNGPIRVRFAEAWPGIAASYAVLLYVAIIVIALSGHRVSYLAAFGSLLTVLFIPHVDAVLERAAQRLERMKETPAQAMSQLRIVALRTARIVVIFAAALFLLQIWGINLFNLAQKGLGARFAGALVDIGLTVLVAFVLWQLARIAIERRLAAEGTGGDATVAEHGEQAGQGASRIRTLLPLLRVAVQVTIIAMSVMTVLSALGVDIGPLLAGAGVIGLAVGFGAQTLVRDIVSGVFFLVDDAFRLGEYIDVGAAKGTVEKISLRSLRLRHHRGALHTIPFGEIQHLSNYSRDWAIMKLEFRVPFDTDLEKVRKIFKKIGQDLQKDPDLGPDFLEPFKSQGVLQTDDSAFVIRGKFMSKPGRQFVIRRMIFQAVQKAFAEEGIHFADRRVTVNVPGADHLAPEERAAAEKAAASAVASLEAQRP